MTKPDGRKANGGARPNTGPKPKPAGQTATVRFSLSLTPAEAEKYRLLGAPWVRRMMASLPIQTDDSSRLTMSHHNDKGE